MSPAMGEGYLVPYSLSGHLHCARDFVKAQVVLEDTFAHPS